MAINPDNSVPCKSPLEDETERQITVFEAAWRSGHAPSVADENREAFRDGSQSLLWQLVAVDLEYRWNSSYAALAGQDTLGLRPTLARYVEQYPAIGSVSDLPVWLMAEEYRVRQLWGGPAHARPVSVELPRTR